MLHQKLQLLNSCIRKSLEGKISLPGNSSEDEFFDCSEGENDEHPPWDRPVGRLSRFGDAIMKNGSPLYIPRTQVCMTYCIVCICPIFFLDSDVLKELK